MADSSGRNTILLSDGTGNSAGKLFKTNVWRVYDALDLSNASQIAAYDDGVGTSSIKPLAVFGGAVGWGLKRNVLRLYRKFRIEKTEYYGLHTLARPIRDGLVVLRDLMSGQRDEMKDIKTLAVPEIEFLGLWDTVDAYGLPV